MRNATRASLLLAAFAALLGTPALAYVGPGAGISLLGALWGVIVAVVLATGMVLFWPIRIMLRKRKAAKAAAAGEPATNPTSPAAATTAAQPDSDTHSA